MAGGPLLVPSKPQCVVDSSTCSFINKTEKKREIKSDYCGPSDFRIFARKGSLTRITLSLAVARFRYVIFSFFFFLFTPLSVVHPQTGSRQGNKGPLPQPHLLIGCCLYWLRHTGLAGPEVAGPGAGFQRWFLGSCHSAAGVPPPLHRPQVRRGAIMAPPPCRRPPPSASGDYRGVAMMMTGSGKTQQISIHVTGPTGTHITA